MSSRSENGKNQEDIVFLHHIITFVRVETIYNLFHTGPVMKSPLLLPKSSLHYYSVNCSFIVIQQLIIKKTNSWLQQQRISYTVMTLILPFQRLQLWRHPGMNLGLFSNWWQTWSIFIKLFFVFFGLVMFKTRKLIPGTLTEGEGSEHTIDILILTQLLFAKKIKFTF